MSTDKVIQFAKEHGYETVERLKPWNGYECYEPIMSGNGTSMVGPPLLILVKGESIRMSTVEESFQQMDDMESVETAKSFKELLDERSES